MKVERDCNLSDSQAVRMTTKNDNRYGGADNACEITTEWPISWMMVGRNTGMELNAMLVPKNISAVSQHFASVRVATTSARASPFEGPEVCADLSFRRRRRATFFSRGVRYVAAEGESGIVCQATTATSTLGKPSSRKSNLQEAIGEYFPSLMIAQARVLAKLVASGAAEMKNPVLRANSSLLKKKDR